MLDTFSITGPIFARCSFLLRQFGPQKPFKHSGGCRVCSISLTTSSLCFLRVAAGGSGANARVAGDDEEMQRFVPIEDLFIGRHCDLEIIVLWVDWYTSFNA